MSTHDQVLILAGQQYFFLLDQRAFGALIGTWRVSGEHAAPPTKKRTPRQTRGARDGPRGPQERS
eukprot:4095635-Pyramimonas_sp.AAC.1